MRSKKQFIADFKEEAASIIDREGVKELIEYLEKDTDFFSAPASTRFHGAHEFGLVMHTLSMLDAALMIYDSLELNEDNIDKSSVIFCALFHDICKANFYVKEKRNKKIDGKWVEVDVWAVKDQLPMGHGEKSVYLVQKFVDLTDEEAMAIRWHLGGFDPGVNFMFPSGGPSQQSFRENKLVALMAVADFASSYLLESWKNE